MVVVMCLKEWISIIKVIFKEKFDFYLRDCEGFIIFYYCIEVKKDDFIVYFFLFFFLDSGLCVFLNLKLGVGFILLNLVVINVLYSWVLCILKLVYNKENMVVIVDKKGWSLLYNVVDFLFGVYFLIVLERLIWLYIFLR